jgi:hypothetical protein
MTLLDDKVPHVKWTVAAPAEPDKPLFVLVDHAMFDHETFKLIQDFRKHWRRINLVLHNRCVMSQCLCHDNDETNLGDTCQFCAEI